ncbi:UNVERIFIED_CONTAM: Serine/threonine-protein phosphatase 7 long form [Sesamum radiatum]|uniref:Serine/threonine-protein phosphatase 7 long form n=1 Tax=Sesamum radiatum TaxID=300843 RepID=A0AAW2L525_SESRA
MIAILSLHWWRGSDPRHTFHFRVGEATITLQDVQIIWALPIDGEPVTGLDLDRTTIEWQDYCLTYLGFRPSATAFKGSRLQTHAIISHIAQVEITYDTLHEIVVQYARAVALLLLGGVMCPDSSENLIPLLYLTKLEDIVEARNYSWGSAVLAFFYRELCNATNKEKAAIGGALQLLQFIWQPYDMDSDVIMAYAADFNPQLWRSSCPLIFYAIVEMHHPERVLRQFGMRQNIPEATDTRDMSLHQISHKNRTGTDWNLQHIQYISRWQRRYDTVVQRPPISNRRDTERGYWEWYNNITRHFVSSSTNRRVESGYQPGNAPMLQVVTDEVHALDAICQSTHLPLTNEECRQLVDRFTHGIQIIKEALPHLSQQIATSSDNAPTTSHRQRRSSSRMSIGLVERDDVGVDLAGPSTRVKATWLTEGDKNTAYFHARANERRIRNEVKALQDISGTLSMDPNIIRSIVQQYFTDMFQSTRPLESEIREVVETMEVRVTKSMNEELLRPFDEEEIHSALQQMYPLKSPGPDDMPPLFYQKHWNYWFFSLYLCPEHS